MLIKALTTITRHPVITQDGPTHPGLHNDTVHAERHELPRRHQASYTRTDDDHTAMLLG